MMIMSIIAAMALILLTLVAGVVMLVAAAAHVGRYLRFVPHAVMLELAAELLLPTFQAGQSSTVQRWLDALGRSAIQEYPHLAVLAAWFAVLTGQTVETQRSAAFVDTASFDLLPTDGTASSTLPGRCWRR
jgi:hypothetical protein